MIFFTSAPYSITELAGCQSDEYQENPRLFAVSYGELHRWWGEGGLLLN
jgi:hypothetical protein